MLLVISSYLQEADKVIMLLTKIQKCCDNFIGKKTQNGDFAAEAAIQKWR